MNWNMTGHEWAVDLLRQHVANGLPRHAYLLTGPKGIGRRTLALRFAQAVNCTQPAAPGEPCGECRMCKQIERQQFPDLHIVQLEPENKDIKIEQVRELQHRLALAPFEGSYRVALLLGFEQANASTQNAMLKTLEEAPKQVILILTADRLEGLLPTIVSRCEVLRLRPLPLDQTAQYLVKQAKVSEDEARLLAHLSGGRVGYAIHLSGNRHELERRQTALDSLQEMLGASRRARFAYIDDLTKNKEKARENLRQAAHTWLAYWRDVMLCAAESNAPLTNLDREEEIRRVAACLDLFTARRVISNLENGLDMLDANANIRLLGEVLLLDMPRVRA